jgi:thiamine kinase-like enzyme
VIKILFYAVLSAFFSACQSSDTLNCGSALQPELPAKKPQDQYYNELKKELFSCDRLDSGPTEPTFVPPISPSILSRVISHPAEEMGLSTDELKILVQELSLFRSKYEYTPGEFRNPNSCENQIYSIKADNYRPRNIKTKEIRDAARKTRSSLENSQILEQVLGEDTLKQLGSVKGPFAYLWSTFSKELANKYFGKNLLDTISKGFFADKLIAWKMVADYSPLMRKMLQRAVANLKETTQKEIELKKFLSSILLSHSFTPEEKDPHVIRLKKEFGAGIKVSGLATASIGSVYLLTCRQNNKDRKFVVKTGIFSRDELGKKIEEDLKIFDDHADLLMLYPELSTEESPRVDASKEEKLRYLKIVKEAIKNEILKELDFTKEAQNLRVLQKAYEKIPQLKIVKGIPWAIDSEDYLFMEYAQGEVVSSLNKLSEKQARSLGAILKELYDHILYQKGPYHADTHPGNIIVDNNGGVTLIDAGRINEALNDKIVPYLLALEIAFDALKSMPLERNGNAKDNLISLAQRDELIQKMKDILSPPRKNLSWYSGTRRTFIALWEILQWDYQRAMSLAFRQFFINKMSFLSADSALAPVTKALRAIQLIDDLEKRLVKPFGVADFLGKEIKAKPLDPNHE